MDKETASICAELSNAVYNWDVWDYHLDDHFGICQQKKITTDNHEVGLLCHKKTLYVVVRGTEADDLDDILTDLDIVPNRCGELGGEWVHGGFRDAAKSIWQELERFIITDSTLPNPFGQIDKIVCTGHSLGGAVATILAIYIQYWEECGVELYTFGSPKVLSDGACRNFNDADCIYDINHYRFVNNNDIVPKLPLNGFVWEHCGDLYYINRDGKIIEPGKYGFWNKFIDGIFGHLADWNIDSFRDHSIQEYIKKIK